MLDKIEIIRQVEKKIKNNDFKGALGEVTKCLEFYPNFVVAKVLKAECLLRLNNTEEALALVNEVLFSAPDNIKARKIAVEANLQLGNIEEAKGHIDFLGFLLPSNHPYLEEVKAKVLELEKIHEIEEETPDFEIERTEIDDGSESPLSQGNAVNSNSENIVAPAKDISEPEKEVQEDKREHLEEKVSDGGDDFLLHSEDLENSSEGQLSANVKDSGEVEEVSQDELVTGVLQEQISTVTLPEKKEEPEIKTRTLALIYERQGMFQEALEILENLFEESKDTELLKDMERIKAKLKGDKKGDFIVKKIKVLENWLERVKWHSSN